VCARRNSYPRTGVPTPVKPLSVLPKLLAGVAFSTLVACSHDFIPNTQVEDSDFNRQVIAYCEDYRRAVERRNTGALLQMADPKYYEDGGTIDTSDDLDLAGLEAYLKDNFKKTTQIRYEIFYRDVSFGRANQVYVDFTYSASYKVPAEGGPDVWRRRVADNRLELVQDGEKFRILSGM
jgi:hypothetical protein